MPPYLVLDACILMSGVLRPWLLKLGAQGLFYPVWSDRLGHEWRRNAARIWTIDPSLLEREWQDMERTFERANVSRWPDEPTRPTLQYSDAKDWHVIEAACQAQQRNPTTPVGIVTFNIKDFSRSELRRLGVDLWDPDRLLSKWWETHQAILTSTLEDVVQELIEGGRRHPAPLPDFLKRERLFRLNKLLDQTNNAGNSSGSKNITPL